MGMFLVIAGCIWVGLSIVLVLSLMAAASQRVPPPNSELVHPAKVALDTQDSPLTPAHAAEEKEIDPVLDV